MLPLRAVARGPAAAFLGRSVASIRCASSGPLDKSRFIHPDQPVSAFPLGYQCAATHCGVKKTTALDLGLLVSESAETSAAATFTRNVFQAAPVHVSREVLLGQHGRARALIVNSGCANAVTGKQGMTDARAMAGTVDELVASIAPTTLVLSTGVIGQTLPMDAILPSIPKIHSALSADPQAWVDLSRAFMTTDTFPKLRTKTITLGGVPVRFAGIDKGAGMIHPSMGPPKPVQPMHGTLLGVIATDAAVAPEALQAALTYAVDRSFNAITVDGDMSTNDTVVAFANGASGMERELVETDKDWVHFRDELTLFAEDLAKLVVRDGEGATKFVTVNVKGAPSYEAAKTIASTIATSSLVKTALYGQDANWGRILCAIGYSDLPEGTLDPTKTRVSFVPTDGTPELLLLDQGEPVPFSEEEAARILALEDLEISVHLGAGEEAAKYYTCDFSHEYVTINGDYRS